MRDEPEQMNITVEADLNCLTLFGAGLMKVGIRNSCAECKKAVMNWSAGVGIRRYKVKGHSQVVIDTPALSGQLIGEDPC